MPNNNNSENDCLKQPNNTNLPFFAYGIFKPGQLAYSKIADYVESYDKSEIEYEMLMRDGVPIIKAQNRTNKKTNGYLIKFKEKKSNEAYDCICKTQHNKLYEWEEIEVDNKQTNVLIGVNPEKGNSPFEKSTWDYDGREDPFFKEAIEVIENELNDKTKKSNDINDFFKLQMTYMLLWASIERYASLKYNNSRPMITQFSKDELVKTSLKKHVYEQRTVYSAKDLKNYTLNRNNPYYSIKYYYTIRCNVVHRGKSIFKDESMLRESLKELLAIFKDVLRDTFVDYDL